MKAALRINEKWTDLDCLLDDLEQNTQLLLDKELDDVLYKSAWQRALLDV